MRTIMLVTLLVVGLYTTIGAAADSADNEKAGPNKGLTLQDIGRGLQSAARNIGDEIPKIGPAIGNMFKQSSDKEKQSGKPSAPPPKDKK
jgi:hypothetical protein